MAKNKHKTVFKILFALYITRRRKKGIFYFYSILHWNYLAFIFSLFWNAKQFGAQSRRQWMSNKYHLLNHNRLMMKIANSI